VDEKKSQGSSPVDFCVDTLRSTSSSNDYNVGTMNSGKSGGTSTTSQSDTEGRGTMSPHSLGERKVAYEKQTSSPAKLLHQR
jgi:hypothetical protein